MVHFSLSLFSVTVCLLAICSSVYLVCCRCCHHYHCCRTHPQWVQLYRSSIISAYCSVRCRHGCKQCWTVCSVTSTPHWTRTLLCQLHHLMLLLEMVCTVQMGKNVLQKYPIPIWKYPSSLAIPPPQVLILVHSSIWCSYW